MNKPVNCGCGGKSDIHFIGNTYIGEYHKFIGKYFICCEECGIKTSIYNSKKEAIEAWNKAMGAKDINVPNKERTAKVEDIQVEWSDDEYVNDRMGAMYHYGNCGNCSKTVSHNQKYCHECGARLEWE